MNKKLLVYLSAVAAVVALGLLTAWFHAGAARTDTANGQGAGAAHGPSQDVEGDGRPQADGQGPKASHPHENPGAAAGHIQSAARIYANEQASYVDRFTGLMDLAMAGDRNALHLAYRMLTACNSAMQMSKATILPEAWSDEMGAALARLQSNCSDLASSPYYQQLAERVNGKAFTAFEQGIRSEIMRRFADGGSDAALAFALDAFKQRPDRLTAQVIAKALGQAGVTRYDPRFKLHGAMTTIPNVRVTTFDRALQLLACDYGVPCGPGSDVVLRMCALYGACPANANLYQTMRALMSQQAMDNVDSVLNTLRQIASERG